MAAMREALEMFCGYAATVLNTGMFNRVHLEALLNKAKAALARPPRNCDLYDDEVSATQAFMEARPHNCYAWSCADLIHWMLNSSKKGDEMEAGKKACGVCQVDTNEGGAACRAEG